MFQCSNYRQRPKTKAAGYSLIVRCAACLAIRITFLRTLGCFMEDSMIYGGGVAGYEAGGVRRGLRRVLTRGRRRAIGRLGIDRATSSKRPARASQPPPTLISNHPTPRYLSEFSGQSWSHWDGPRIFTRLEQRGIDRGDIYIDLSSNWPAGRLTTLASPPFYTHELICAIRRTH